MNDIYILINNMIHEKNVSKIKYSESKRVINHENDVEYLINQIKSNRFLSCLVKDYDKEIVISVYYNKEYDTFLIVQCDSPLEKFRSKLFDEQETYLFLISIQKYLKKDFYFLS